MRSIVHRMPLTKARINLGQVVRRVHVNREYFILEKDGIPVAGIMSVVEMEDYLGVFDRGGKKEKGKSSNEFRAGQERKVREVLGDHRPGSKGRKEDDVCDRDCEDCSRL